MKRTLGLALLILTSVATLLPASAQDSASVSVIAGHLINPHGLAIASDGSLVIAEAGSGGEATATDTGPFVNGATGRISRIESGCPVVLADGLPSARAETGEIVGPSGVAVLGDRIFALSAGGGASHGSPETVTAVVEVTGGQLTPIADLTTWLASNPVANPPQNPDADGLWTSLTATPDGSALVAVEQNQGQVVRIGLDGTITRLADLSAGHANPIDAAFNPDGTLEVALFSPDPYAAGTASVVAIAADGSQSPVWTGLTMATALAFGPDGSRYVAEFSEGRTEPPYFVPGSGRIVHQTGPDTSEVVVTDVNFPGDILFGPDGALLIGLPSVGSENGTGQILSVVPSGQPIALQSTILTDPACGGEATTTLVKVSDLGLDPSAITIAVGSTVTWRNVGEFDHAVASDQSSSVQWDSGVLTPGMEFSVTFTEPGTYPYYDGLFPDRTGQITVQ